MLGSNFLEKQLGQGGFGLVFQVRYAVGSTLAMATAMGFDWPMSFLTAVLSLSFLASPAGSPAFKAGISFILTIAIASYAALLIGGILLPYPFVYIPFIGLLLFRLYYAKGSSFPPLLILWLLIALLLIPLMMIHSPALAETIAIYLVVGASAALLVTWISFALFPDRSIDKNEKINSPPPLHPKKEERFQTAVDSTIVVFPVLILF